MSGPSPTRRSVLPTLLLLVAATAPSTAIGPLAAQAPGSPAEESVVQPRHRQILAEQLQAGLETLVREHDGVAGVHAVDLTDGRRFAVRDTLTFPQASAIKIPVLLELFRRAGQEPGLLGRRVEITDEVRTGGSGVLRWLTDGGAALSLEDHAIYMILYSDNTATNVLIDALGMEAVNELAVSLGAPSTLLQRKMIRPGESARGNENLSTPRDATLLMERIHRCELPMEEDACRRVREILSLPKGHPIRRPLPDGQEVAFKPGGITGVATVWALVPLADRPYAFSVMSSYGGDAAPLMEAVSGALWSYFSRLSGVTGYGTRVPLEIKRRVGGGAAERGPPAPAPQGGSRR
jgi:beta-lactamase class A